MATSVHISKPLLDVVDRRAKALGISRNRLIVRALERELASTDEWSPGFFDALARTDAHSRAAADEMLEIIIASRRSKKSGPKL